MADIDNVKNPSSYLPYLKLSFLIVALSITFVVYGPLEGIFVTRMICIGISIITLIAIILINITYSKSYPTLFPNYIANSILFVILIIILIVYISYISISYTLDKNNNILNHTYSNYFISLFVFLCFYLFYKFDYYNISMFQYCLIIICCSVMVTLLYPMITIVRYYKTDGFNNIYIK